MCAVLGLSASGYYAWRGRPESQRSVANRALTEDIRLIHAESSGCYGSPRVHATLRRHGRRIGLSRVERLMRRAGLRGLAALPRRARTTDSRHGYPIAPNRLARNFQAAAPNQIWLADLTYIPTGEGWLYLAAILDMHTLKTERVHHRIYATRDQARRDLFGYIEGFYNPRRLHSSLGYISPAEAERRAA